MYLLPYVTVLIAGFITSGGNMYPLTGLLAHFQVHVCRVHCEVPTQSGVHFGPRWPFIPIITRF
jgi:hypothetical protein